MLFRLSVRLEHKFEKGIFDEALCDNKCQVIGISNK